MILAIVFLAQVELPAGGAAWSAAALLSGVLSWLLFKHLPAKDQQVKDLVKSCDEHNEKIATKFSEALIVLVTERKEERVAFAEALKDLTTSFKTETAAERASCEKHFSTLAETMKSRDEATIMSIRATAEQLQQHAQRNQQWTKLLQDQLKGEKKGSLDTMEVDQLNVNKMEGVKP